jgi:hypothetical protein
MTIKELEAKVKALEAQVADARSIQEIEKLQRIYGYYLDNRLWDNVVALFSEKNTESLEISDSGVYLGQAGVGRFFKDFLGRGGLPPHPRGLGIHMQLQGVVTLDPGSVTGKGRWQCIIWLGVPWKDDMAAMIGFGVYENDYIKEDGIWKFKKMHFYLTFRSPLADGWVKTPVVYSMAGGTPDKPSTGYHPYPAGGYIPPFHYPNPVTGVEVDYPHNK